MRDWMILFSEASPHPLRRKEFLYKTKRTFAFRKHWQGLVPRETRAEKAWCRVGQYLEAIIERIRGKKTALAGPGATHSLSAAAH